MWQIILCTLSHFYGWLNSHQNKHLAVNNHQSRGLYNFQQSLDRHNTDYKAVVCTWSECLYSKKKRWRHHSIIVSGTKIGNWRYSTRCCHSNNTATKLYYFDLTKRNTAAVCRGEGLHHLMIRVQLSILFLYCLL